ncbi:MAG: HAMP domain-containing histidine kinase [Oscillospiraceae bacterium]|jgi:signal transduction histidine kinase|nr:HAMP domain-containing histidine kinase [Oscillospiraceae bacterium]
MAKSRRKKTPKAMRNRTQSIANRWAKNTLGTTLMVLLLLCSAILFAIQQSYYSSVRTALEAAAESPNAPVVFLQDSGSGGALLQNSAAMLDSFAGSSHMAVWLYDLSGKIILSSDGSIKDSTYIPQKLGAPAAFGKTGTVRLPSGEQVMTIITQLKDANSKPIGFVRYLVSLQAVNRQLFAIAGAMAAFCVVALGLLMLIGARFLRTILTPIGVLAETAEKIAGGDMKARVPPLSRNDEFARLCSTVNTMADNLEESNRLKNDFISTISHELRTPLTAIRGWSETLRQIGAADESAQRRGLTIILNESTRLGKMVEELLDFSRMQSGRLTLRKEPLDILAELDEVVFTVKETALRVGVSVRQKVPEFPVRMEGDADRLRQVFINIIDNAVKYNRPGGWVEVAAKIGGAGKIPNAPSELSPGSSAAAQLQIIFEDNGRGIPKDDLSHVKEKFYKVNNGVRGSGIGLAVADEIIRLHGGTLEVDSAEGEGTRVTITLPVDKIKLPELPGEIITLMEEERAK